MDRLFVASMIQHDRGAFAMVDQLFASYGVTQDTLVSKMTSDVFADQTAEIDRMQGMLAGMAGAR